MDDTSILIMATNGFEQSELEVPRDRLREAGMRVVVASPEAGRITGWEKKDWGRPVDVDLVLDDVDVDDYDALVLPSGQINPDILRLNQSAVSIVRSFVRKDKLIAAICHAPWLLIEAGVVFGRVVTSWPSLRTDLENAGAMWRDQEMVSDNGLITSRSPRDLDAFVAALQVEVERARVGKTPRTVEELAAGERG